MKSAAATRLLERAGVAGLLDRWARRRLLRAGDRGDLWAIEWLWNRWLVEPDDVWFEALLRWRQPSIERYRLLWLVARGEGSTSDPAFRAELVAAAARTDHPIGEMARARIVAADDQALVDAVCAAALEDASGELLAFCAEHGLAPGEQVEPADRAVYFLLTGQHDHYRAMDPDGSWLALAYDSAPEHLRGRVQRSVVNTGDVALVRVLTATGPEGRLSRMTSDEVGYLTRRLADDQEWDELWRVVQQLRLVDAVEAVGLIGASVGDGWRPPGDAARALFERLARADVDELRAAYRAVFETDRVSLDVDESGGIGGSDGPARLGGGLRGIGGRFVGGAFSADGRRLAIVTESADAKSSRPPGTIAVFELPSGRLLQQYDGIDDVRSVVLFHDDDSLVVSRGWGRSSAQGRGVVERCVDGRVERLYQDVYSRSVVGPSRGGFVGVEPGKGDLFLRFFALDGDAVRRRRVSLRRARRSVQHVCGLPERVWELPSGLLMVLWGAGCLMVLDAPPDRDVEFIGHGQVPGSVTGVCAPDPDHLITTGMGGVRRWRLEGRRLTLEAGPQNLHQARDPIVIGRLGQVAVVAANTVHMPGHFRPRHVVHYLHAEQIRPEVGRRGELHRKEVFGLVGGEPDAGLYAAVGSRKVEVVMGVHSDAVVALADRSLADMTPADLARLGAELRTDVPGLRAHPFLDLLHACLEDRFSTELTLGEVTSVANDHDIALGGGGS